MTCDFGSCGCQCDEELSVDDQKAFLEEKEKILEAKLATVRYMKDSIGKKSDSHTK